MTDISKWYEPEPTAKQIYEGIYPATIIQAKAWTKEAEKDGKEFTREIITLTFETLKVTAFPDGTQDKIVVSNNYYFDVQMHRNALNGIARAFGLEKFTDVSQFEGKTGIIGITNRVYEKDGETKYYPQFGYGLFSYAKLVPNAEIKYMANDIPNPTEEDYKEWFKNTLAMYKQPK